MLEVMRRGQWMEQPGCRDGDVDEISERGEVSESSCAWQCLSGTCGAESIVD